MVHTLRNLYNIYAWSYRQNFARTVFNLFTFYYMEDLILVFFDNRFLNKKHRELFSINERIREKKKKCYEFQDPF